MKNLLCFIVAVMILGGTAWGGVGGMTGSGPNRYHKATLIKLSDMMQGELKDMTAEKLESLNLSEKRIESLQTTAEDKQKLEVIRQQIIVQIYEAMILLRDEDKAKALRLWDEIRQKLQAMARKELGVGITQRTTSMEIAKCSDEHMHRIVGHIPNLIAQENIRDCINQKGNSHDR